VHLRHGTENETEIETEHTGSADLHLELDPGIFLTIVQHGDMGKFFHNLARISGKQVAKLSQRDRAARWVSYGQKWKTGTGRQYLRIL